MPVRQSETDKVWRAACWETPNLWHAFVGHYILRDRKHLSRGQAGTGRNLKWGGVLCFKVLRHPDTWKDNSTALDVWGVGGEMGAVSRWKPL